MARKKKKSLKDYTAFSSLSAELVLKNLPFILFVGFLMLIYIANAHYSEKKVREIQSYQAELKELRWHYMSLKSDIMYNSKRSEIAKQVEPLGLKPMKGKPKKIIVKKNR